MQPNDLDGPDVLRRRRRSSRDTKWKTFKQRADLGNALNEFKSPMPSHGRDRPLFSQIKSMTQDAFGSLGNSDEPDAGPAAPGDGRPVERRRARRSRERVARAPTSFTSTSNQGRFPADNTSLPKTPLPVISIWFPNAASLTESIYRNNEAQFMQSLANPEIGGFFDIVQEGRATAKAQDDHRPRARALQRDVARALALSLHQPERRADVQPRLREHAARRSRPTARSRTCPSASTRRSGRSTSTCRRRPRRRRTTRSIPGGQFRVYGDFCWSGDKTRAEAYFIPAGTKPDRADRTAATPTVAKKAMQQLKAQHMRGHGGRRGRRVRRPSPCPTTTRSLEGTGDNTVARVVVYDNKAHRAAAHRREERPHAEGDQEAAVAAAHRRDRRAGSSSSCSS